MIAVKCRRVETAVGLNRPAIPAELNDVISHDILPDFLASPTRLTRYGANRKA